MKITELKIGDKIIRKVHSSSFIDIEITETVTCIGKDFIIAETIGGYYGRIRKKELENPMFYEKAGAYNE